jgi:hypothetical protein
VIAHVVPSPADTDFHGPLLKIPPIVKVRSLEVIAEYVASPSLVAVTTHRPAALASKLDPRILQLVPVTAYVTAPEPVPPVMVKAIGVPALPLTTLLLIISGA